MNRLMTVYIEYAFLQNFFLDGALLWLALKGTKTPVKRWRLFLASLIGAFFAIVYPLIKLPSGLKLLLKLSVGFLLCLTAFGRLKTQGEKRKYALVVSLFFALSFLFGGALLSLTQGLSFEKIKTVVTPIGFAVLSFFCLVLIRKMYKKSKLWRYIYACKIVSEGKSVSTLGFFDSGNVAEKDGIPVCFISPETAYSLWGESMLLFKEERGQVCDEMQITTMAGVKKITLYKGILEIEEKGRIRMVKEVYFAPSANMISKEYTLLLHSRIFEEGEEI